jgi:hypothetical protein
MIPLNSNPNVDNSDLVNYPDGRIKDDDGTNNGTGVNRNTNGDIHSTISKLMRLYAIIPNDLPDNETNGFQLIDALRGLASKNDFIYPLSTNGTILNVDIKFSQMLDNEYIICLAQFNKASETQIKGIGVATFSITYSGNFKANEYVRVIKTSGGVSIIRMADAISLDAMVGDFLYLKKASQAEENTGTIDTKATTPLSNLTAFTKRVIGTDSVNFLATAIRDGLYPRAHFSIVAGLGASPVKNIGWFSGLDVNASSGSLAVSGNITAAYITSGGGSDSFVTVTMQNAMTGLNYYVRSFIESQGLINYDNDIGREVFNPISATQFEIGFREISGTVQSLRLHIEVVQL